MKKKGFPASSSTASTAATSNESTATTTVEAVEAISATEVASSDMSAKASEKTNSLPDAPSSKPKPIIWAGGTLVLSYNLVQALQAGERKLLETDKPGYIVSTTRQPAEDLLIRVNGKGAELFGTTNPSILVPRRCYNDFAERGNLQNLREIKEQFDFSSVLKCFDGKIVNLKEHHEQLAVNLWLILVTNY